MLKDVNTERRKIMNYKFKTKPYAHQITALEKSWQREYYAYFMEMGTGKSKVLIDNAAMLYDQGKIDGLLIIAPKGVYKNWYDQEIPEHFPEHIEKVTVLWQALINKKQDRILRTLFESDEKLHILCMNVEACSTSKAWSSQLNFYRAIRLCWWWMKVQPLKIGKLKEARIYATFLFTPVIVEF